jgi:hypothetical protein
MPVPDSQFIPYLESVGFEVTPSLFTPEFFRLVYKPGHYLRKTVSFAGLSLKRLGSLWNSSQFDVILLYREMFPIGPALVERLLASRSRPPIVFDFDDAIFLPSVSDANRLIAALKRPQKVAAIVRASDHVITGNEYLADYARRFNPAVTTIPTSVDTSLFVPSRNGSGTATGRPTRWSAGSAAPRPGRISAASRTSSAACGPPSVRAARQRRRRAVQDSRARRPDRAVGARSRGRAVQHLRRRRLPARQRRVVEGKCGFKAIEFMACGVR